MLLSESTCTTVNPPEPQWTHLAKAGELILHTVVTTDSTWTTLNSILWYWSILNCGRRPIMSEVSYWSLLTVLSCTNLTMIHNELHIPLTWVVDHRNRMNKTVLEPLTLAILADKLIWIIFGWCAMFISLAHSSHGVYTQAGASWWLLSLGVGKTAQTDLGPVYSNIA